MATDYAAIREAIVDGDADTAAALGRDVAETAENALEAVDTAATVIREVGDRFGAGEIYLPEMVLAAEAMQAFMDEVTPRLEAEAQRSGESRETAKVVIGTVKGDIHSIGKNIVATMLSASGYEIIDLGVNVVPMDAISEADRTGASIIGLSALMTTSMPYQKEVVSLLTELDRRNDYWVIVGGGPVTSDYADEIGSNGWAPDAAAAVQLCDRMMSSGTGPATAPFIGKEEE
ncbi:MAG: cobalamin-dependent protein [Acidimicrobiia bacterium]|nr:cobalamin-dependent protein [Acidimicrobiia bacterium]